MQPHVLESSGRRFALSLLQLLHPKHLGRACRARETAPPTRPPPESRAKLQGGWAGETSSSGAAPAAKVRRRKCPAPPKMFLGRERRAYPGVLPTAQERWPSLPQLREVFPPAPKKGSQAAGRAGRRDHPRGHLTSGRAALALRSAAPFSTGHSSPVDNSPASCG